MRRLLVLGGSGRRRLTGGVGESREGLGVADGDVREDLAVELDAGELEAVHELSVAHAVLPRGGVDARDPQAAEVALAVAAGPGRGGGRPHYPLPFGPFVFWAPPPAGPLAPPPCPPAPLL